MGEPKPKTDAEAEAEPQPRPSADALTLGHLNKAEKQVTNRPTAQPLTAQKTKPQNKAADALLMLGTYKHTAKHDNAIKTAFKCEITAILGTAYNSAKPKPR